MEAESLIRRREDEEEGIDGDEKDSKRQRVEEGASSQVLEFENPLLTLSTYDDDDEDENGGRVVGGENGGGLDDGVNGRGGEVENVNERIVDEENGHGGGLGNGANGHGGVVENDNEGGGENGNGVQVENGEEEEEVIAGGGGGAERVGGRHIRHVEVRRDCPYLDTVNRQVLDFDFEKFCSVSLSNLNVYACLVCGKYFQGRGHKSHAYTHSLEAGHHVYINLRTEKVYCLPDGYEINDPSLDDIRHVLNPRFNREQVEQIDKNKLWSRALDGSDYLPGMVGLNNIKDTDFVNVTIQSLMRVTPLRNFFLIPENYQHCKSPLVHRFGELTRKIWHARNFKGQVSPHEFLQAVMKASKKRFRIGAQSDPVEFMSWLLSTLHADIRTKKNYSVIYQCFQGELEVGKDIQRKALPAKEENGEDIDGESEKGNIIGEASKMPFLMLGLDLPPPPLFKDVMEKNIIPQVQLFNIFKKFDGKTVTEVVRPHIARMRYRVTRLPPYLILHMRRFTKNNFFMEKNPTLGEMWLAAYSAL